MEGGGDEPAEDVRRRGDDLGVAVRMIVRECSTSHCHHLLAALDGAWRSNSSTSCSSTISLVVVAVAASGAAVVCEELA